MPAGKWRGSRPLAAAGRTALSLDPRDGGGSAGTARRAVLATAGSHGQQGVKAQTNKGAPGAAKGELVDRGTNHRPRIQAYAGPNGEAWINWPESHHTPILAAELGIDEHTCSWRSTSLSVHLEELGEFVPKVDG